jgi:hypothetical protein
VKDTFTSNHNTEISILFLKSSACKLQKKPHKKITNHQNKENSDAAVNFLKNLRLESAFF